MVRVTVRTPIHPSEDPAKVRKALLNLFPDARIEVQDATARATTESLSALRLLIRRQKILDAARKVFLRSLDESRTRAVFSLGKQAAYEGRVSFSIEGSPLGDLVVEAQDEDLEALLKEMAPMTLRGIPLTEEQAEREMARRRNRKTARPSPESAELVSDEEWQSLEPEQPQEEPE